jgi:hypothetical protein
VVGAMLAMATLSAAQGGVSEQAVERIQKEVRHEILMLPF